MATLVHLKRAKITDADIKQAKAQMKMFGEREVLFLFGNLLASRPCGIVLYFYAIGSLLDDGDAVREVSARYFADQRKRKCGFYEDFPLPKPKKRRQANKK